MRKVWNQQPDFVKQLRPHPCRGLRLTTVRFCIILAHKHTEKEKDSGKASVLLAHQHLHHGHRWALADLCMKIRTRKQVSSFGLHVCCLDDACTARRRCPGPPPGFRCLWRLVHITPVLPPPCRTLASARQHAWIRKRQPTSPAHRRRPAVSVASGHGRGVDVRPSRSLGDMRPRVVNCMGRMSIPRRRLLVHHLPLVAFRVALWRP